MSANRKPRDIASIVAAFLLSIIGVFATRIAQGDSANQIPWLHSDAEAFAQAQQQQRYVLLYLEAVWCHWCHVMDERTYGNAQVMQEISAHYVPLRIDQDLRPDLANRYRDYGWPATVVFESDGTEIVKRQGFIEPERFLRLLRAIVADPSPEAAETADAVMAPAPTSALATETRQELLRRHHASYDEKLGGLSTEQKYLDRDSVEYALMLAQEGDHDEAAMARKSLDAAQALIDPVWGGVYQYSTYSDWKHPHFEKLATVQAQYLRIYALAYAAFGKESDRAAVNSIRRYLNTFLRHANGAFFASQDADVRPGEHSDRYFLLTDAKRRAQGIPHIDSHLYALQNGEIIEALATVAELSSDADALTAAKKAAAWIETHRSLPDGGFRHDEHDAAGPYLSDTLAMGRAYLALYRACADRHWLNQAGMAADFIARNFEVASGGYASARSSGPIPAVPQIDENISLARFANLLARYTGKPEHQAMAAHAMRYLSNPKIALERLTEAGILLAERETNSDPLHLTVTGAKSNADAKTLFSTVQHLPHWYKRVEWWDKDEGPLPNPDINYPTLKRPAAFVCTENRCSLPIFKPEHVAEFLTQKK